jgi:hypothetical protein
VVLMLLWPRRSCTTLGCTPSSSNSVACVCRSPLSVTRGRSERLGVRWAARRRTFQRSRDVLGIEQATVDGAEYVAVGAGQVEGDRVPRSALYRLSCAASSSSI